MESAHRIWTHAGSSLELGAQPPLYTPPARLIPLDGTHPAGVIALLHRRLGR